MRRRIMQAVSTTMVWQLHGCMRLWWLGLMIVVVTVTGCATNGTVKPSPTAVPATAGQKVSVTPLKDGLEGFIITEHVRMDASARDDFRRAVAMLNEGNDARAIELLEKVIQKSPGVTAPYIDLALAYERTGKLEKAEANLKIALGLVPDHPLACNQYGLLCRKAGRFDEARTMYEKTLARFPEYYPAHRNLGILCDLYLNDGACALKHYEIYSRANPEDKKIRMWIADLQNRMNN